MPEEIELDVREQQEKLEELHREHEEHGHEEHQPDKKQANWARGISLSTAVFAVVAAVAALHSGTLVNEALLEANKATAHQAQASDKWAEYQADSIKGRSADQAAVILTALGANHVTEAAKFQKDAAKYEAQKQPLKPAAEKLEEARDEQNKESAHHMHMHHIFAYCVTITQVAIALSAIAALTRRKDVWYFSLAAGAAGFALMVYGYLQH